MCTGAGSATVRNLREEPRVRLALPDTSDVVLLEGEAECHPAPEVPKEAADAFAGRFGWDPRTEEAPFVYLRVASKVHLSADRKCRPLAFVLTVGQAADSPQFIPVLKKLRVRGPIDRPRTRPDAVAGDKAYSSRGNRAHLGRRGIKAVIPEKKDQAAKGS